MLPRRATETANSPRPRCSSRPGPAPTRHGTTARLAGDHQNPGHHILATRPDTDYTGTGPGWSASCRALFRPGPAGSPAQPVPAFRHVTGGRLAADPARVCRLAGAPPGGLNHVCACSVTVPGVLHPEVSASMHTSPVWPTEGSHDAASALTAGAGGLAGDGRCRGGEAGASVSAGIAGEEGQCVDPVVLGAVLAVIAGGAGGGVGSQLWAGLSTL